MYPYRTREEPAASIAIAGGGICGMAAAVMLADLGHRVTVVERDSQPVPTDPDGAFEWDRKGVAQFTLGHWLHSRGTSILRSRVPRAHELLIENGAFEFNVVKALLAHQPESNARPEDDQFDIVTGRRSTLEWALATAADEHPGVSVRRGEAIAGFLVDEQPTAVPHVTGLELRSGEQITSDLVIDATGRRSQTPQWLDRIGASSPTEEGEDSGFAYYGRYLRSSDGSLPPIGSLLAPYGSFSILSLPADNGTWSLTLYGLSDDKPLRRFRDPEVFGRVVRACPAHRPWLEGEPMTELLTMAGGVDRHREFVVGGKPCATGVLTVGDAASCTNPSLGRGITLGLMHVETLVACIADHLGDPEALALAFHRRTAAEIRPWHEATVEIDRRRVRDMRIYRDGGIPEPTTEDQIGNIMGAAMGVDPIVLRAMAEIIGCHALVSDVVNRPGMTEHILGFADQVSIQPPSGPNRTQLLALVS